MRRFVFLRATMSSQSENNHHFAPSPRPAAQVIAIVGAGFCGTMIAARLLGRIIDGRTHVVLINRPNAQSSALARGLAYGTDSPDHLLNVPAGRMSAFDNKPDDFLRFLHTNNVQAAGGSFVPRHWYGRYLRKILQDAADTAKAGFSVRQQVVSSIQRPGDDHAHRPYRLQMADGDSIVADCVVLALGNFPPANPIIAEQRFFGNARYIRDPWSDHALSGIDVRRPVLLIGSGLTMFDVVVSLSARAQAPLRIHVVSRRGLWPQPHREHVSQPSFDHAPPAMLANPSARAYLRAVREHIVQVEKNGGNWRDVVAGLRPITPQLWQALSITERQRFLRHVKPYWETHRHRAAPEIFKLVAGCANRGELTSIAARILAFEVHGNGVKVHLRARGDLGCGQALAIDVGAVINCTGPASDINGETLLKQMAADGLIAADALRLGIEVAADYRVCDAKGAADGAIFYVGPLLKARDWEATAVPELRTHAEAVVNALLKSMTAAAT